ncbi:hypothetical protein D5086_022889 [Populus alba]|uniref:Uncharacterized protein n=1 Tax=Populus alba TaxID=43335 RepID=A0ACC4BA24_POPAL
MASKAVKTVAKAVSEYQYPWKEKLAQHKNELSKGVWGYWKLGAWTPLHISARRRARLRKEVLLAEEDWPYDPERKEMRTKMKGHKCDRIAAERRANTAKLMEQMPEMLLAYKKRVQRTYQCVTDSGNKTTGSMRLKNDGARAILDENIGSNNELNNEKTLSIIKGD